MQLIIISLLFTAEDDEIPSLDTFVYPNCDHITFSVKGIENLLQQLDPSKAPGSDGIPTCILKLCKAEIAPILQVIFTQSFTTNTLPTGWLTANAIRKVIRTLPINILTNFSCLNLLQTYCFPLNYAPPIDQNKIFNNYQYGSRPKYPC